MPSAKQGSCGCHFLKSFVIVLVITDNAPRSRWNIGKICAIEPDEQEIVRKVVVSVKGNRIRRPIHKLCLLIPNQEITDDKSTDAK